MDLYLTFLALGAFGLAAMAFGGFGRHGHASSSHGGHGHAGHVHGARGHAGHSHGARGAGGARGWASSALSALTTPRSLFSICLGLGTTGLLLRPVLGVGLLSFVAALAGGVIFERVLVTPIWNFGMRFESNPALTLESSTGGDATAVSSFDANGQGLISLEVDGQVVQLLGTLQASDRELGARVVAGSKLRVEDVDPVRNRCTVSLL